jgi:hypothetical protein
LVYNTFARFRKDEKESIGSEQHQSIYKRIIAILSKDIKTKGLDDEKVNQLKDMTTTVETLKLTLAILEPFLNVQFSFIDKGESVDNYRNKTPEQQFTPKQYIIVSTDQTFVSTSSTVKDKPTDKVSEMDEDAEDADQDQSKPNKSKFAQVVEGEIKEDEEEEEVKKDEEELVESKEAELKEAESKVQPGSKKNPKIVFKTLKPVPESAEASTAASETKFKFLGRRLPELKGKSESKEPTESESKSDTKTPAFGSFFKSKVKETKAESKSESKAESKDETKSESKAESKLKSKPLSKAESKDVSTPDSKAESKSFSLFKGLKKTKESKPEVEPTNLEAAGIFNKDYKPEVESKKPKPTPSKLKPGAPRRQSAKFVENLTPSSRPKSATSITAKSVKP